VELLSKSVTQLGETEETLDEVYHISFFSSSVFQCIAFPIVTSNQVDT